ncbi:MAG: pyridoxal-5'-phosphate-dependent protein subunit beta [Desulfurococcaceae archaeon]
MMSCVSWFLKCLRCGLELPVPVLDACPRCGGVLVVEYTNPVFRVNRGEHGIWRYASLLPGFTNRISLGEGLTPIGKVNGVVVKNEKFNPTGSYADRASAIIASYVKNSGATRVSLDYFPDFTRSTLHYLRDVEVEVVAKSIFEVEPEDMVFFASRKVEIMKSPSAGYLRVGYVNPFTVEGLKTIVFELYERGVQADYVVVPAKTGLLALSLYKGLKDLNEAGIEYGCDIVAATVKGLGVQLVRGVSGIRIVEIPDQEVYESFKQLVARGFKIKLLAALSYHVARVLGNAVAVMTMGFKPPGKGERSAVKQAVLEVLARRQPLTAYEIWRERPIYTLRAVYKAVRDMELRGEVCYEVVSKGKRKVKLYSICR